MLSKWWKNYVELHGYFSPWAFTWQDMARSVSAQRRKPARAEQSMPDGCCGEQSPRSDVTEGSSPTKLCQATRPGMWLSHAWEGWVGQCHRLTAESRVSLGQYTSIQKWSQLHFSIFLHPNYMVNSVSSEIAKNRRELSVWTGSG